MRRILTLFLSLILIFKIILIPQYAEASSSGQSSHIMFENFDMLPVGAYTGTKMIDEKKDAEVVEEGGNRVCRITVNGSLGSGNNSVFTSKSIMLNSESIFTFKIRNARSSEGKIVAQLRSDYGLPNEYSSIINFVDVSNGSIVYLPQMSPVSESLSDNEYADITVRMNNITGEISVWRDGNIKSTVSNYKSLNEASWREFDVRQCLFRFQTSVKASPHNEFESYKAEAYVDNISYKCTDNADFLAENFEDCTSGQYNGTKMIAEKKDVKIVEENNNRISYINIVGESGVPKGSVFTTDSLHLGYESVFAFRIRNANSNEGGVVASLRSEVGSADEYKTIINFVRLADGKIEYLPQMAGNTEEISDSLYADITVKINSASGEIAVYRDGVMKCRVENFRAVHESSWKDFCVQSCLFRFQTIVKATPQYNSNPYEADIYIDDIEYSSDTSIRMGLFVGECAIYYLLESELGYDSLYPVNNFKNGRIKGKSLIVNDTNIPKSARMILSHMRNNNLRKVQISDEYIINSHEAAVIDCDIEIDGSMSGDTLEIFIMESTDRIIPLKRKSVYNQSVFDTPVYNELSRLFAIHGQNIHPRIVASKSDFEKIKNNSDLSGWKSAIISEADRIVLADIDSDSEYKIYYSAISDGTLLYMAQKVRKFMENLGMAYQITDNAVYADKAYEIMNKAGNFRDWAPHHFLGTAEMTGAFAIGYDWMYDAFTDEQRTQISGYIKNKGVAEGKEAYSGTGGENNTGWWQFADHNWNVVCNGGMIVGAAAIADNEPELSFYIIKKALQSLKLPLKKFSPDGAWTEGYDYVEFMFQMLSIAERSLVGCFGSNFGISSYDGMDKAGDFMLQIIGAEVINNFHDAWLNPGDTPQLMWLAKIYNKPEYGIARVSAIESRSLSPSVYDLIFYDDSYSSAYIDMPLDAYFRGVEYVSSRSGWDKNSVWISYHGGKAYENHSHIDCGTFIFEAMGERWACDLGADNYNAPGYFDEAERYKYYRTRAEAHNTLVIDPDMSAGQSINADTKVISCNFNDSDPCSILDLTSAYSEKANSVKRSFRLTNGRSSARIDDEIHLKSCDSTVYWFMHTKANIRIIDNTAAELTLNGKRLRVNVSSDANNTQLTGERAEPFFDMGVNQNSSNEDYQKLQIKMSGSKDINLSVSFVPLP